MTNSVGIVVPAYDPAPARLERYVEDLRTVLAPETIRVELDAPDRERVRRLSETDVDLAVSDERRGKGAAVMAGFDALDADIYAYADADGSIPSAALAAVFRRFLGDAFAFIARRMLPTRCRDYQCGTKAVDADIPITYDR